MRRMLGRVSARTHERHAEVRLVLTGAQSGEHSASVDGLE